MRTVKLNHSSIYFDIADYGGGIWNGGDVLGATATNVYDNLPTNIAS
jgi:hypothetical protein